MTIVIEPNTSKAQIIAQTKKLKKGKQFDAYKHLGKVQWGQDALEFQREMRAE
jgi:hypothetical protein